MDFIFQSIGRRRRRVRTGTRQAPNSSAGQKQCGRIRLTGVSRVRLLYTPYSVQTLYGQILILLYLHNIILHIVQTRNHGRSELLPATLTFRYRPL